MNNLLKIAALLAAVILSLTALTGCGGQAAASSSAASQSAAQQQTISAVIRVTGPDETVTEIPLTCAAGDTLANALLEAGVISPEEAEAGYVTVVNGIAADYSTDKAWWALVDAEGEMTAAGIGKIKLAEGDIYGLVYTIG